MSFSSKRAHRAETAQAALVADLEHLLARSGNQPAVQALLVEAKQGKFSAFGRDAYDFPLVTLQLKLQALDLSDEAAALCDVMVACVETDRYDG